MKHITFFTVFLLIASGLNAQATYTIQTSDMEIKGTSTFHDWELKATRIKGAGEMNCEGRAIKEIKSFYLEIPVKSLKSTNGSTIMEDKVWNALRSASNQSIIFRLAKINSISPNGDDWDVNVDGTFTIAGVNTRESMDVHAKIEPDGSITFTGIKKLKMNDYKIDPPKAMLGALTTGNEVEINFRINVSKI